MYTAQGQCILELEPDVVCLEQVAHIMKVDQSAVKEIIEKLETVYVVHSATHGNSKRMALRRRLKP